MSASLLIQKVKPELYDLARKYEYVHSIFEKMAGGELVQFNNSLFLSEKTSHDRDCSLAYFMRENKCFPPGAEIKQILDFYSQVNILFKEIHYGPSITEKDPLERSQGVFTTSLGVFTRFPFHLERLLNFQFTPLNGLSK